MKNLAQKTTANNNTSFTVFSTSVLSTKEQVAVKGGTIITEEVLIG